MVNLLDDIIAKNKEIQDFCRHATPYRASVPQFEGDIMGEECKGCSPL